jgi:NTE family protein
MNDNARQWAQELTALRGRHGSPFAPDAEVHVISVSLRDVKDAKARQALLQVPTALTILPVQVRQLGEARRSALRDSPEFQQLRDSLMAEPVRAPLYVNYTE